MCLIENMNGCWNQTFVGKFWIQHLLLPLIFFAIMKEHVTYLTSMSGIANA